MDSRILEGLFARHCDAGAALLRAARERAEAVAAASARPDAARLGAVVLAADVLVGLCSRDDTPAAGGLQAVLDQAGESDPDFRLQVGLRALRDPALLELPPHTALGAEAALVTLLARLESLSLWTAEETGALRLAVHRGPEPPDRRAEAAVRELLTGDGEAGEETAVPEGSQIVPVLRWGAPRAALVARPPGGRSQPALVLLHESARLLGAILERDSVLQVGAQTGRMLLQAAERGTTRLGFDLHDGPLQEVALLAGEADGLHRRVQAHGGAVENVQEIEALRRLAHSAEQQLRSFAGSLQASARTHVPVELLLRELTEAFAARSGIPVDFFGVGELSDLTDSQRIVLLRTAQEALSNVHKHSGASTVAVTLRAASDHMTLTVADDGRGFAPVETLEKAAESGRLGLLGLRERVRMLGGRAEISSSPGGPTSVSVTLARWRPADDQAPSTSASASTSP